MTGGEPAGPRPSLRPAKMVQSSRKLLAELVQEALQPLTSLVQQHSLRLDELRLETIRLRELAEARAAELGNMIIGLQQRTENEGFETGNRITHLYQSLETQLYELSNLIVSGRQGAESRTFELSNLVRGGQLAAETKVFELSNALAEVRNKVIGANQLTETRMFEAVNLLHDLNNRLTHLLSVVANVEISVLHQIGERFQHRDVESVQRLLAIEAALRPDRTARFAVATVPQSNGIQPFERVLARAKEEFPRQFADWLERLQVFEDAIELTPVGNLANWADPYSHAFKSFVEARAIGSVLDIGCGQFERPIYLSGFPKTIIHGLDPLPAQTEFDFPVARGIGEYLPWQDGSFDTLISATSIDHALSLDQALAEMERVLAADGRILMWVGSIAGAKRYEPDAPDYVPADKFHLFHIDRAWFEPMLEARFVLADRVVIWTPAHEHVFYMLTKKRRSSDQPSSTQLEIQTGVPGA